MAGLWGTKTAILAYDTEYLPPNPFDWPLGGELGEDGLAGPLDYSVYPQSYDYQSPFMAFYALPCASNANEVGFRDPGPADWSNTTDKKYTVSGTVQKEMQEMTWNVRDMFDRAVALFKAVHAARVFARGSEEERMAGEVMVPTWDARDMVRTYGWIIYMNVRTPADATICMRGWQRNLRTCLAFIDWVGAMMKGVPDKERQKNWPWVKEAQYFDERYDRYNAGGPPRRGVVFVNADAANYQRFLRKFNVPTYVRVNVSRLGGDGGIPLTPLSHPRCKLTADSKLCKWPLYLVYLAKLLTVCSS